MKIIPKYTSVCIRMYIYIYRCVFLTYALIHTSIREKNSYKFVNLCVYICESIFKWVCVHIDICIYVYLYQMCEIKFEQI